MGRQIGFYMLPQDEAEFIAHVCASPLNVIMLDRSSTHDMPTMKALPVTNEPWIRTEVMLRNDSHDPRLIISNAGPELFVVDLFNSEVIEFSRCTMERDVLRRGRLWIDTTFTDNDGKVLQKSKAFISWYGSVVRWIKKNYDLRPSGYYVGPHAQVWAKNGGQLK